MLFLLTKEYTQSTRVAKVLLNILLLLMLLASWLQKIDFFPHLIYDSAAE